MDRNRRAPGPAVSLWRRQAFTLAALLAIFLQAFVVQTHIHTPVAPIALSAAETGGHGDQHVVSASDHPRICAICQVLSSSSAAPLPDAAAALVAERTSAVALVALALAPRTISYFWQSRAPPSFL